MFEVNYNKFIEWLVPPLLRRSTLLTWIRCLVIPVQQLYTEFMANREVNNYKLSHNGQVCYLQKALNDAFDIGLRRIRITDTGSRDVILIDRDEAQRLVQLPIIIHRDEGYADGNYDFIVQVPSDIDFTQEVEYHMRSVINFYKLAGKRYKINIV